MDRPPERPRAERIALRASDMDRERVAAQLREHYAEGRLTVDEFQERLEKAYAARTMGDLDQLTWDLPADSTHPPPPPASTAPFPPWLRSQIVAFAVVSLTLIAIWAITNAHNHFFWPIWVILFWGMGLAFQIFNRGARRRPRDRARYRRERRQRER